MTGAGRITLLLACLALAEFTGQGSALAQPGQRGQAAPATVAPRESLAPPRRLQSAPADPAAGPRQGPGPAAARPREIEPAASSATPIPTSDLPQAGRRLPGQPSVTHAAASPTPGTASLETPPTNDPSDSTAATGAAIPLRPRSEAAASAGEGAAAGKAGGKSSLGSMITVGSSLAMVLGLFFVVAWALRKQSPSGSGRLPREVLEVLGHGSLPGRQQLHLLRCGPKLLLVANGPTGVETLTEINEPEEVERVASLCQRSNTSSTSQSFRQLLDEMGSGPHQAGFLESRSAADSRTTPTRTRELRHA